MASSIVVRQRYAPGSDLSHFTCTLSPGARCNSFVTCCSSRRVRYGVGGERRCAAFSASLLDGSAAAVPGELTRSSRRRMASRAGGTMSGSVTTRT